MRTRPTLATGALLATAALAATTGLTGSAAHATVHPGHPHAARAVIPVTADITATTTKKSITLSTSTITPGNTTLAISGPGSIEVMSLKAGYSIDDVYQDAKKLFGPGNVKYVRRIDKKVTFYGGIGGGAGGGEIAMNLPAGSYYVANLDKKIYAPLTVVGTPAVRALPAADGTVKMVQDMTFHAPDQLPNKGWLKVDNRASEPHFLDLAKVKKGTTRQQIRTFLAGGAQGQPSWGLPEDHEALVVSPGHSFEYYLTATKGEYVELCFWPSNKTGMPHALMGMFDISQLG